MNLCLITAINLLAPRFLSNIKTIPNILIAFLITSGFIGLKERHNKVINFISKYSFSVYLFHQVPVFYPVLWASVFHADKFKGMKWSFVYVLVAALVVYLIASVIEELRKRLIENNIIKTKLFNDISNKLESFYK